MVNQTSVDEAVTATMVWNICGPLCEVAVCWRPAAEALQPGCGPSAGPFTLLKLCEAWWPSGWSGSLVIQTAVMWSDWLSTQKTPQVWFLEQSKSCISKSHTAIWSHWPVLVPSPSVVCNWSHHCIMGDLIGPRWGDLCSTRSLTPLLLVSSPNHHSSIPFTISCSPFPPFFFFTPPLSSGFSGHVELRAVSS